MPYGNWATVREAADHYGVSRQRIHQLMAAGRFGECRKLHGLGQDLWLIPHPYKRVRETTGRPRKTKEKG